MVDPRLKQFAVTIAEFMRDPSRANARGAVAVDTATILDSQVGLRWLPADEFEELRNQLKIGQSVEAFETLMRWLKTFDPTVTTIVLTVDENAGTVAYRCDRAQLAAGEWFGDSMQVFLGARSPASDEEVKFFRDVDTRYAQANMVTIRAAAAAGYAAFGRGCIVLEWRDDGKEPGMGYNTIEEAVGIAEGVETKVREMVNEYDPAREVVLLSVRGAGCSAYRLTVAPVSTESLDAAALPVYYLRNVTRRFPNIVKGIEELRAFKKDWDSRVFVPADKVVPILYDSGIPEAGMFVMTHVVTAALTWRMTKGVYLVEPEVLDVLWRTRFTHDLPWSLLNLPEWCPYVSLKREVPHYGLVDGFWVRADQDTDGGAKQPALNVVIMPGSGNDRDPWAIPVPLGMTLVDAIKQETVRSTVLGGLDREKVIRDFATILEPIVAVALYVNARGDIVNRKNPALQPSNPQPKKTKSGVREFASDQIQYWEVAYRVAKQLRATAAEAESASSGGEDASDGGRRSPRPHLRRGYFGVRWRGPRTNPEPTIKWINPTTVNARTPDDLPATVIKVQD